MNEFVDIKALKEVYLLKFFANKGFYSANTTKKRDTARKYVASQKTCLTNKATRRVIIKEFYYEIYPFITITEFSELYNEKVIDYETKMTQSVKNKNNSPQFFINQEFNIFTDYLTALKPKNINTDVESYREQQSAYGKKTIEEIEYKLKETESKTEKKATNLIPLALGIVSLLFFKE